MLEIKTTAKGLGLFAQETIKAGTCIIHEPPLVVVRDDDKRVDNWSSHLEKELQRLRESSPGDYDDYMALACYEDALSSYSSSPSSSNSPASSTSLDSTVPPSKRNARITKHLCIFYTNCAELQPSGRFSGGSAIYRTFSRINHSCIPNAAFSFGFGSTTGERPWITVCAVRDLAAGEEITVPYIVPGLGAVRRADKLSRAYGFKCACPACQGPRAAAHEACRRKILAIDEALKYFAPEHHTVHYYDYARETASPGVVHVPRDGDEALALAKQRVSLLRRTGLVGPELVAAYVECLQYAGSLGRLAEAARYGRAANLVFQVCSGLEGTVKSDNDEDLESVHDGNIQDDERNEMDSYAPSDVSLTTSVLDGDEDEDEDEDVLDASSNRAVIQRLIRLATSSFREVNSG